MALVDLKSKLNQFRGENNPNNPYQKSGKRDTDLESNIDINTNPERKNLSDTVDGEGRQILGQTISTQASTFLKGLKNAVSPDYWANRIGENSGLYDKAREYGKKEKPWYIQLGLILIIIVLFIFIWWLS